MGVGSIRKLLKWAGTGVAFAACLGFATGAYAGHIATHTVVGVMTETITDKTSPGEAVLPNKPIRLFTYHVEAMGSATLHLMECWVHISGLHKFHPLTDLNSMNYHVDSDATTDPLYHLSGGNYGEWLNGIYWVNVTGGGNSVVHLRDDRPTRIKKYPTSNPDDAPDADMWDTDVWVYMEFDTRNIADNGNNKSSNLYVRHQSVGGNDYEIWIRPSDFISHRDIFYVTVSGIKVVSGDSNDELVDSNFADYYCDNCPNPVGSTEPVPQPTCYPYDDPDDPLTEWPCLDGLKKVCWNTSNVPNKDKGLNEDAPPFTIAPPIPAIIPPTPQPPPYPAGSLGWIRHLNSVLDGGLDCRPDINQNYKFLCPDTFDLPILTSGLSWKLRRFDPDADGFSVYYWPDPEREDGNYNKWFREDCIWVGGKGSPCTYRQPLRLGRLGQKAWEGNLLPPYNTPADQACVLTDVIRSHLDDGGSQLEYAGYRQGIYDEGNTLFNPARNVLAYYDQNGNGKFDFHIDAEVWERRYGGYYNKTDIEADDEDIYFIGAPPEEDFGDDTFGSPNYSTVWASTWQESYTGNTIPDLSCEAKVWDVRPFYSVVPGDMWWSRYFYLYSRPSEYLRVRPDKGPGAWEAQAVNWPQRELMATEDWYPLLGIDLAGGPNDGEHVYILNNVTVMLWDMGKDGFDAVRMLDRPVDNPVYNPWSGIWLYTDTNKNNWFDGPHVINNTLVPGPDRGMQVCTGPTQWVDVNGRTDVYEEGASVGPWWITLNTYKYLGGVSVYDAAATLSETTTLAPNAGNEEYSLYDPTPDWFIVARPDSGFQDYNLMSRAADGFGAKFGSNFKAYIPPGGLWIAEASEDDVAGGYAGYRDFDFSPYLLFGDVGPDYYDGKGASSTSMLVIDADGNNNRGNTLLMGSPCSNRSDYDVNYLEEYGDEPGFMAMAKLNYTDVSLTLYDWLAGGESAYWDFVVYPEAWNQDFSILPGTPLELFDFNDNVYWYDTSPKGTWNNGRTYDTNNWDGLWIEPAGNEDGIYGTGGETVLVEGELQLPSVYECLGRELNDQDGFAYYDVNSDDAYQTTEKIVFTNDAGDNIYRSKMRRFIAENLSLPTSPAQSLTGDRLFYVDVYTDTHYTPWVDALWWDGNNNGMYDGNFYNPASPSNVDALIVKWPIGSGTSLPAGTNFRVGITDNFVNLASSYHDMDSDGIVGEMSSREGYGFGLELAYFDKDNDHSYDVGEDIVWDHRSYGWDSMMEHPAYYKFWAKAPWQYDKGGENFAPLPVMSGAGAADNYLWFLPEASWGEPDVKMSQVGLEVHDYLKRPGIVRYGRALEQPKIDASGLKTFMPVPVAGINVCSSPDPVTNASSQEFLQKVRVDFIPRNPSNSGLPTSPVAFKPNVATDSPNTNPSQSDLNALTTGGITFVYEGNTIITSESGVSLFKDNKLEGEIGVFDLPADTAVPLQNPQWRWDSTRLNWYVDLQPANPLPVPLQDYAYEWSKDVDGVPQPGGTIYELQPGANRGDDFFVCILPASSITYENEIQVKIWGSDSNSATLNEGIVLQHGESAPDSTMESAVIKANMPAHVANLSYRDQTVDASSSPVPAFGISIMNDNEDRNIYGANDSQGVWFESMVVELYDEGADSKFSPSTDLNAFKFERTAGGSPSTEDVIFSGMAIYRDDDTDARNRNGVFDPPIVTWNRDGSGNCQVVSIDYVDEPLELDGGPTFIGQTGEPTQLELSFKDPTHRQRIPANNTGVNEGSDFFVVFRTSEYINDGDDFRFGLIGMGPEEEPWGYRALGFYEIQLYNNGASRKIYPTRAYASSVSYVITCERQGAGPPEPPAAVWVPGRTEFNGAAIEVPTGVEGEGNNKVTLCWLVVPPNPDGTPTVRDLEGYLVFRSTDGTNFVQVGNTIAYSALSSPEVQAVFGTPYYQMFTDTSVTNGILYYYYVVAKDTEGCPSPGISEKSVTVDAMPGDPNPACPSNVSAVAGNGLVTVSWDSLFDNDIVGYFVYRRTSATTYDLIATPLSGATPLPHPTENFTDTNVVDGTTYYYLVIAVDEDGNRSGECVSNDSPCACLSAESNACPVPIQPPDAPTLSGTGINCVLTLMWTQPSNYDLAGYRIYKRDDGGFFNYNDPLTGITPLPVATVTFIDGAVQVGSTYCYVIRAVDSAGSESADSNEVCLTCLKNPPPPPRNLRVTGVTSTSVSLAWDLPDPSTDVAGYRVYRSTVSGLFATKLAQVSGKNTLTYKDTTVKADNTYYYVVTAIDASQPTPTESVRSNQVSATVRLKPAAPTGLVAYPMDAMVLVDWDENMDYGIAGYQVNRTRPTAAQLPSSGVLITPSYYLDYGDVGGLGLISGQTHAYKVRAKNTAGYFGDFAGPAKAYLGARAPVAPKPAAVGGKNKITLSWKDASAVDVTTYYVYRSLTRTGGYTLLGTVADTGRGPNSTVTYSYTDTSVTTGVRYYYRLKAMDKDSLRGAYSLPATAMAVPAPAPVINLEAFAGDTLVLLTWDASTDTTFDHYSVYYSTDGATFTFLADSTVNQYTAEGLTNDVIYYFYVTVWNTGGYESDPSNIASAMPYAGACPTAAPRSLRSEDDDYFVMLQWNPSSDPTVSGYRVYRIYPMFELEWTLMEEVDAATTWWVDIMPETYHVGNEVCYYVTAVGGLCESGPSNQLCGVGRPAGGWGL